MIEITLSPELLAALGISAEGLTSESLLAALNAHMAKVQADADAAAAKIAELQAKLDEHAAAAQAARAAGLDAELSGYELTPEQVQALRDLILADEPKGKTLLSAMPKKAAPAQAAKVEPAKPEDEAAGKKTAPPPPVHDPKSEEVTPEQLVAKSEALIKAVQKEGRFPRYQEAREEARRRSPELFQ